MARRVDTTANESIQQTADIKFLLCCIESMEEKPNMSYVADRLGINKDAARKRWDRLQIRLKGNVKEEHKPRKPRTKKSEMVVRDGSDAEPNDEDDDEGDGDDDDEEVLEQ